jgi:hypothetical protein
MEREGNAALIGQVGGFGLQQGLSKIPNMNTNKYTGTNDFKGVNGGNAMSTFLQFGRGGD